LSQLNLKRVIIARTFTDKKLFDDILGRIKASEEFKNITSPISQLNLPPDTPIFLTCSSGLDTEMLLKGDNPEKEFLEKLNGNTSKSKNILIVLRLKMMMIFLL